MNKHIVKHEGQTFTRNSKNRTYPFVAVVKPAGEDKWFVIGWAGRSDLAEKQCVNGYWSSDRHSPSNRGYGGHSVTAADETAVLTTNFSETS